MIRSMTLFTAVAFAAFAVTANAAVIGTLSSEAPSSNDTNDHIGTIQAIDGDLLETSVSAISEGANGSGGRHVTASVYNGKVSTSVSNAGNGGDPEANNAAGYWGAGHWVEFNLDTTTNTLGYDISLIQIIQRGDGFRPGINVAVSLRPVGGSFSQVYTTGGSLGTAGNVNEIAVTDNAGPLVASGIDGVRFDFGNTGVGWTWYRELDVVGIATVPEPASLALLGMGGLMIARRRR